MEIVANIAFAITDVETSGLQKAREPARALCRSHRKMFCLECDAEGLDAPEYCRESFHLGQEISGLNVELLDLAASVAILGILEAYLSHGYCRRSDHCLLVFFRVFGIKESCSSKVSRYPLHKKGVVVHT